MKISEWSILIENIGLPPWHRNLCIALVFLHVKTNCLQKTEELICQAKFFPSFQAISLKLGVFLKF